MAKESDDLMSALEDTLHRILLIGDEGDVNEIMGARRANDAEMDALAENDEEFIEIDDGYILPGYIAGMKKLEARRIKSLADLLFLDDRIVEFRTTAYPFPLTLYHGGEESGDRGEHQGSSECHTWAYARQRRDGSGCQAFPWSDHPNG